MKLLRVVHILIFYTLHEVSFVYVREAIKLFTSRRLKYHSVQNNVWVI